MEGLLILAMLGIGGFAINEVQVENESLVERTELIELSANQPAPELKAIDAELDSDTVIARK